MCVCIYIYIYIYTYIIVCVCMCIYIYIFILWYANLSDLVRWQQMLQECCSSARTECSGPCSQFEGSIPARVSRSAAAPVGTDFERKGVICPCLAVCWQKSHEPKLIVTLDQHRLRLRAAEPAAGSARSPSTRQTALRSSAFAISLRHHARQVLVFYRSSV